jgi:hypothetical protein
MICSLHDHVAIARKEQELEVTQCEVVPLSHTLHISTKPSASVVHVLVSSVPPEVSPSKNQQMQLFPLFETAE